MMDLVRCQTCDRELIRRRVKKMNYCSICKSISKKIRRIQKKTGGFEEHFVSPFASWKLDLLMPNGRLWLAEELRRKILELKY